MGFLTYLSKDPVVIDAIRARARSIFPDKTPATLNSDTDFFGRLLNELPRRVFQDRPSREARKDLNRALDRTNIDGPAASASRRDARQEDDLDDVLSLNVSFKTLQILGQVVRNFAGSLLAEEKTAITLECFALGLRTLSMLFGVFGTTEDELVQLIANAVYSDEKQDHEPTRDRAERRARRLLAWMIEAITAAVIQRVSSSIGTETLRMTFDAVQAKGDSIAFDLVDIAIKLDHFSRFPLEEIEALAKRAEKHSLAMQVLRGLVVMHFYRFPRGYDLKQTCCDRLGMEYRAIARLEFARSSMKK